MIYVVTSAFGILAAALAGLAFSMGYCFLADRAERIPSAAGSAKRLPLVALAFVAEFWIAAILAGALILTPPEADRWTMALGSALVIWIGFVVPVVLVTHRYRALSTRAALIDCGRWLVIMIVRAAVLQAIGLQNSARMMRSASPGNVAPRHPYMLSE